MARRFGKRPSISARISAASRKRGGGGGGGAPSIGVVQVRAGNSVDAGEIQTVTITGATGGTFTLNDPTFTGETDPIAWNASANDVRLALNNSPGPGGDPVFAVTGDAGGPWTIEWLGTFSDRDLLTTDGSGLT